MGSSHQKKKEKSKKLSKKTKEAVPSLTKEPAPPKKQAPPPETCPSFNRGHLPKEDHVDKLRSLSEPHVESFNYFLEVGLKNAIADLEPAELDLVDPKNMDDVDFANVDSVQFWVEKVRIRAPSTDDGGDLLPRECRELGLMYSGPLKADFCYRIIKHRNGLAFPEKTTRMSCKFGDMPIMVMSNACHLKYLTIPELARAREEHTEFGGYFIVNGIERCVRLLQIPRRNHPMAIQRPNYKNRGPTYSDLGVATRCSRYCGDQSSITNTVHYLTTGGASLKFVAKKQEFLVPIVLILRALSFVKTDEKVLGITDGEIYARIMQGDEENKLLDARARLLLREAKDQYKNLNSPQECLAYLGSRFRSISQKPGSTSNIDVGHFMIRRYVMVHLPNYHDKLECLLLMLRKLYSFVAGDCGVDNADSLQNQEILLPGHLLTAFVKEKFEETLSTLRLNLLKEMRQDFPMVIAMLSNVRWWGKLVNRSSGLANGGIGKKVQHFLSTGNIISTTGLDLMQTSGYTIVAERLNFLRYCAHFRSVHRGQFFMEMKTTSVRKLLPDQWGFLCPVHTPDGGPCGLLSHLSLKCSVLAFPAEDGADKLDELLISLGVIPTGAGGHSGDGRLFSHFTHLPVCLDGRVVGSAPPKTCKKIASVLREMKVDLKPKVPATLEVAFIPVGNGGGPYPGLYLFTDAGRLVRPVIHRATGQTEKIGPMEQPFMDIACLDEDVREGVTTHQELDATNMLSLIASLTPFSDYNQSPRNMYQCQMGKQTMGTPCHSLPFRTDNKLYKLQNPQAPVVQTSRHGEFKMDEYPNGTNAIVAVLSYTGFDMEDAMILNKGSFERGFGHASVYKSMRVSLEDEAERIGTTLRGDISRIRFGNRADEDGEKLYPTLGNDGLPELGALLKEDDLLYCVVDDLTGKDHIGKHKDREEAYVDTVRVLGPGPKRCGNDVSITLRYPRNPVIGDKFSSRHGQKGVLSIVWPQRDMPFSESGICPDVIINPHAFPSRMTIGMLIESMAGKSGALNGMFQDATPFTFHESGDKVAVDYFGEQLQQAGYNYYGSEPLYSGVSGCLMQADLYIGVVYYQRLRHMVSDKYQVRASGPVNPLTRQPIKGRKKGGGIRLGEMERDSLLSHGAAFLLHDRLLNCSDKHVMYACTRCGDLLAARTERHLVKSSGQGPNDAATRARLRVVCRNPKCQEAAKDQICANDYSIEPIIVPYVFRYLANELAGMGIKMILDIK